MIKNTKWRRVAAEMLRTRRHLPPYFAYCDAERLAWDYADDERRDDSGHPDDAELWEAVAQYLSNKVSRFRAL